MEKGCSVVSALRGLLQHSAMRAGISLALTLAVCVVAAVWSFILQQKTPTNTREGNDYGHERAMTYQQVLDETCRVVSGRVVWRSRCAWRVVG